MSDHPAPAALPRSAPDLRRRVERELAEELLRRARWLPPADGEVMEAHFRTGLPVSTIARQLCIPARTLRRQIRALSERLLSDRFMWAAMHRDELPPTLRRIATLCILHNRTIREAARRTRTSTYFVRRQLDLLSGLYELHRHALTDQPSSTDQPIDPSADPSDPQIM